MTATQSLNLYNIAFRYFKNEADATSFIKEIEFVVDNKFETQKDLLATKQDIHLLDTKISETKSDILKWLIVLFLPFYVGMIVFLIKNFIN
jgi:hypothetical protein